MDLISWIDSGLNTYRVFHTSVRWRSFTKVTEIVSSLRDFLTILADLINADFGIVSIYFFWFPVAPVFFTVF